MAQRFRLGALSILTLWAGSMLLSDSRALADDAVAPEARALLQPLSQAVLSSEITGRIVDLKLRPGDSFAKGDTLIRFDCTLHQAQLKVAQAVLRASEATLENNLKRQRLKSAGALEVELAKAEVERAKGEVEVARFTASRCRIRAPFGGRVIERAVNPFETVPAGEPMLSVLDDRKLEVKLVVPSGWLSWLGVGTEFTLVVDETGESHKGWISRLGAQIDAVSQSVPVFGGLKGKPRKLMAGMSGTARFVSPQAPAR